MELDLSVLLKAAALVIGGTICIALFAVSFKILASDNNEYRQNKKRSGSLIAPVLGRLDTFSEGHNRDHRVGAGMAVDTKKNQWVEQGALSEEAVDNILR